MPVGANEAGFLTLVTLNSTIVSEFICDAGRVIVRTDPLNAQVREDDDGKVIEQAEVSEGTTLDGKVTRTRPEA